MMKKTGTTTCPSGFLNESQWGASHQNKGYSTKTRNVVRKVHQKDRKK